MTLVERSIEINGWTTSRKTALLSGFAFQARAVQRNQLGRPGRPAVTRPGTVQRTSPTH